MSHRKLVGYLLAIGFIYCKSIAVLRMSYVHELILSHKYVVVEEV